MHVEIVHWPNPILTRGTSPVTPADVTAEFRDTVAQMTRLMVDLRGVGLAAPQAGIGKRFMIVCPSGEAGDEQVLVNPEIVAREGEEEMEEGCLSFPGVSAVITRRKGVRVRYVGLDGAVHEVEDDGLLGRCCLHEMDHLDGITFLSKMTPADKLANRRALRALEERVKQPVP